MKKSYSKMGISFQSMALATGVSSGCYYQVSSAMGACSIYIPEWDETVYADFNTCDWTFDEKVCYDVPAASSNVFDS